MGLPLIQIHSCWLYIFKVSKSLPSLFQKILLWEPLRAEVLLNVIMHAHGQITDNIICLQSLSTVLPAPAWSPRFFSGVTKSLEKMMAVACHSQDTNILNMFYFYPVFLVELFPLIIFHFLSSVDH